MKRTCYGCKALHYNLDKCDLGFETAWVSVDLKTSNGKIYKNMSGSLKPLEECPKPKTNDELIICNKLKREGRL
ncbi:hypothetical protein [uncultured Arcobacter sp.]|uniref:hypothetical protein n=1 Tax=uncultured Arcobacter sp. TaxID=165434 RepID=UPI002630C75B|nr:hypothetical protein [uncultured Arcobacter sp.]